MEPITGSIQTSLYRHIAVVVRMSQIQNTKPPRTKTKKVVQVRWWNAAIGI